MSIELLSANHAAATATILAGEANRNARGFGSGVYPITPQTECIEKLCSHEFTKGEVVRVESEHSAMAVCMGFVLSGARSFTASASNGLAYMIENVYNAALYRLPMVMMAANRTLGPPWNIWVDHGDALMLRDSGWIQFFCEDNQEVLDTSLLAYRLAEDHRILLPVLVNQDAFVLSHTMMQTDVPDQELVDRYLPDLELPHRITDVPVTIGGLDFPHETEVHRRQHARPWTVCPKCSPSAKMPSKKSSGGACQVPSSPTAWRMPRPASSPWGQRPAPCARSWTASAKKASASDRCDCGCSDRSPSNPFARLSLCARASRCWTVGGSCRSGPPWRSSSDRPRGSWRASSARLP